MDILYPASIITWVYLTDKSLLHVVAPDYQVRVSDNIYWGGEGSHVSVEYCHFGRHFEAAFCRLYLISLIF